MTLILIFILVILLYALVSRLASTGFATAPIVFTTAGIIASLLLPDSTVPKVDLELFLWMAEIGLVLLLFTDAARTDLRLLKDIRSIPTRLLSIGMLLTIFLGALIAKIIFPGISIWEAGIIGAILAPTDAGLGQIIVNDERVPADIRQALNVEAGLNDGLSVPFLLFFIALAAAGAESTEARLVNFLFEQLILGTIIGGGVGFIGGRLLGAARKKEWMAASWQQLGVIALPLISMLLSEIFGASMFIAAFVAGMALQAGFRDAARHAVEFAEENGQILNLAVFFLFGIVIVGHLEQFEAAHLFYAVLSLTIIRMVPVAAALIGTGLNRGTVLFMGWFGPRGLASIVLALVYLRELHQPEEITILLTVMMTVLLSIYAHGASAVPGIDIFVRTEA